MFKKKEIVLRNGETLVVEIPNIEDSSALANYLNEVTKETKFISRSEKDEKATKESQEKYLSSISKNENNIFIVGKINNKIVADGVITNRSLKSKMLHRCVLGIAVLKEHWGKGIAGKIMLELIDFAKSSGFEQIELEVVNKNKSARKLYSSFGFKEYGRIKHSMKLNDGKYYDNIIMIKFLK